MFFNDDILFRNGHLALVWMAGQDEFKNKSGRRRKEFQALLKTNIITVCKGIRALFPTMGTKDGLGLKKMGTLMKGVCVIYEIKMDVFARDVREAANKSKRSGILDEEPSSRVKDGKKSKPVAKQLEAEPNKDSSFGRIHQVSLNAAAEANIVNDTFGEFGGFTVGAAETIYRSPRAVRQRGVSDGPGFIQAYVASPDRNDVSLEENQVDRRGQKRPREENEETVYQDVLQKLQMQPGSRAHCIPEDDNGLGVPDAQPEFDFGSGDAMLDFMNMYAEGPNVEAPADEQLLAPASPREDQYGAPSIVPPSLTASPVDFERLPVGLETPEGARTRPENLKRRRGGDRESDADRTMHLEELQEGGQHKRRVLTRRRLLIDTETTICGKDLIARVQRIKSGITDAQLHTALDDNRAPGKSDWKRLPRGLDFINVAGVKYSGSALQDLSEGMLQFLRNCKERVENVERPRPSGENTTNGGTTGGISVIHVTGATFPDISEHVAEAEESRPAENQDVILEGYDMEIQEEAEDARLVPHPESTKPELSSRALRRRRKSNVIDEHVDLGGAIDGTNCFHTLYPPQSVSRKKAAMAFFALLKMQAKGKVVLIQNEPYGPLQIERVSEQ